MDRNTCLSQAQQLLQKSGTFTREDSAKVDALLAMADTLVDKEPLRRATLAAHAQELGLPRPVTSTPDVKFNAYLRHGKEVLTQEERARIYPGKERTVIRAAEGVGTGSAGGYLVPDSFSEWFWKVLKDVDQLFFLATPWVTATGSASGFPILDDTANEAAIVDENTTASEVDMTFAALEFGLTPRWNSGYMRCSWELVQDSHFPLEKLIAGAAAVRFARGIGAAFITTLLAAAAAGVTCASTTNIAPDELVQLAGKVDSAWLNNSSWLMQRSTYISILQLVGSSGNFMFPATNPPSLLGFPVYFSPSMGALTAGSSPVTFGDHSRFIFRQVANSLSIRVLNELFALYGQAGYQGNWRVDGGLLVSGSNIPVAKMTMAAS